MPVSENVEYPYTQKDILIEPNYYMYTPFQGKSLLKAYFSDRDEAIDKLIFSKGDLDFKNVVLEFTSSRLKRFEIMQQSVLSEYPNVTANILYRSLLMLLGGDADEKWLYCYLSKIVSRYEVKRQLFPYYDKRFIRGHGNSDILILYILSHCSCIAYYKRTENMKFFNTALKLGDLIISRIKHLEISSDKVLAATSLSEERICCDALMVKQGVNI